MCDEREVGEAMEYEIFAPCYNIFEFSMVKFTSPGEQGGESTRPKMDAL